MTCAPVPPVSYRLAVITFMDILGFRALVEERSASEIRRILNLVQDFAGNDDDTPEEDVVALNFSDSVIRIRYYDTEYPIGALNHEVLSLIHAQGELINNGVLVRGGVTTGEVFCDSTNVFGPGFNRAYGLESEFANYPRIVVGPEAFHDLRSDVRLCADHHDTVDEIHYLRGFLKQGDDGLWFVDYLAAIRRELDEPEFYPDFLLRHRNLVIDNAAKAGSSLRILQKYLWLARYHNDVCERTGAETGLLITSADIPALEDLSERSPHIHDE